MFHYSKQGNPVITCEAGKVPVIMENTLENHEGCWVWTARTDCGYGVVHYSGDNIRVHRMAYEVFVGPIPEGLLIRHRCHNRRCCNPLHLEPGTDYDNWLDMLVDGHTRLLEQDGSDNQKSKLTEEQVYEIREKYKSGIYRTKDLAEEYGVTRRVIERTISGVAYSCYTKVPPYDWRDLDVDIFRGCLTRKGKREIENMLESGCSQAEIYNTTPFTRKMVFKVANKRYEEL